MGLAAEIAYEIEPSLIMEAAGKAPDPWQREVINRRAQRILLNCARQSGKSLVMAAAVIDEVMRRPGALILVVCPAERQSKEFVRTTALMYKRIAYLPSQESTTRLEFANGARVIALPSQEANIRGFSGAAFLILDEAARIPDAVYHAVRPMISASNGRIACLSTPFGKRGFFHKEWTEGTGWERVTITSEQCPRHTPEFLAEEKRAQPESWYRQEYFCEFTETEGAGFNYADVMRAISSEVEPLFGQDMMGASVSGVEPLFQ